MSSTAEYAIWVNMTYRCSNANASAYKHYGGRGIRVCARWSEFAKFYEDMGPRPSPGHQVDRKDNDAGYSPDNCRWATRKEQASNRRTSRIIAFRGQSRTMEQWATRVGISKQAMSFRLDKWSLTRALTTRKKRTES